MLSVLTCLPSVTPVLLHISCCAMCKITHFDAMQLAGTLLVHIGDCLPLTGSLPTAAASADNLAYTHTPKAEDYIEEEPHVS